MSQLIIVIAKLKTIRLYSWAGSNVSYALKLFYFYLGTKTSKISLSRLNGFGEAPTGWSRSQWKVFVDGEGFEVLVDVSVRHLLQGTGWPLWLLVFINQNWRRVCDVDNHLTREHARELYSQVRTWSNAFEEIVTVHAANSNAILHLQSFLQSHFLTFLNLP